MNRIRLGRSRCGPKVRKPHLVGLERMEPRVLLATYTVCSTADDGLGSLRSALIQINQDLGPGSILFDCADPGVQTITLMQPLPAITNPVVIDGTSQPGCSGQPLIRIDGSGVSPGCDGLVLAGGSSVVKGLVITGFRGAGIVLQGGGGNIIQGNILGADPTGTLAA